MKIAISSTGQKKESLLDQRFGRCDYFQIYDAKTDGYMVIENKGISAKGGAGIAAASQIIDEDVEIIITGNLGPNAFELLEKAKIKAFRCDTIPIDRAIVMYEKNQLSQISSGSSAHHGM